MPNFMGPPHGSGDLTILTGWWSNPCEPSLLVYIEAFGLALKDAVMTLIIPQWDDVARGFIRPAHRHEKRRGRKRGGFQGIPELGEIVGQEARAASPFAAPTIDEGGKILWTIDNVFQHAGYVVLIHTVLEDFYFDLIGMIEMNKDSVCPGMSRIEMEGGGFFQTPAVGWTAKPMTAMNYNQGMANHPFSVGVPAGQYVAIYQATVVNNDSTHRDVQAQVAVQVGPPFTETTEYSPRKTISPGATEKMMATAKFHGPVDVAWNYFSADGETFIENHKIDIFQFGD